MPDGQASPEGAAEAGANAPASPTPSYVTQDQLTQFGETALSRIADIVAASRQPPPPVAEPPQPTIDLEDIETSLRDGSPGAAGKILRAAEILADRKVAATRRNDIDPLRAAGSTSLEAIAKDLVFKDDPIAQRFRKEVEGDVAQLDAGLRGNPDAWRHVIATVKGRHYEELKREAVESAIRTEAAKPVTAPPSEGAFLDEARTQPVPTPEQLLGENTKELMGLLGVRTADELAQRRGHKDWKAYVQHARTYDMDRQFDPDYDFSMEKLYPTSAAGVRGGMRGRAYGRK